MLLMRACTKRYGTWWTRTTLEPDMKFKNDLSPGGIFFAPLKIDSLLQSLYIISVERSVLYDDAQYDFDSTRK